MKQVVVEFSNAVKTFGSLLVIEGISLQVFRNEIITLMGPSGCGKTTLLRMIAGQELADSREALWVGVAKEEIGFVLQRLHVFPWLTVRENVEFGLAFVSGPRDGKVERMLKTMGLSEFSDYYPQQLSGGMLQRVALGRALVLRPKLLLLDEPFTGLDYVRKEELSLLLLRLKTEYDVTLVVVVHDIEDAIELSERIVVLSSRPARVLEVIDNSNNGDVNARYRVFHQIVSLLGSKGRMMHDERVPE